MPLEIDDDEWAQLEALTVEDVARAKRFIAEWQIRGWRDLSPAACRLAARRRRTARSKVPVLRRRARRGSPAWSVPSGDTGLISLYSRLSRTVNGPEASPQ